MAIGNHGVISVFVDIHWFHRVLATARAMVDTLVYFLSLLSSTRYWYLVVVIVRKCLGF